jgi:DNA ligase (NAD+)
LTPVAYITPVLLSGVTIRQASLHNLSQIHDKDIRLGDQVWIQRSWEVIPYIIWPIIDARTWEEKPIMMPVHCPACQTALVFEPPFVLCPNLLCPGIIPHQIRHAVSKDCLDIGWLWDSIVDILCEQNLLHQSVDIFSLHTHQSVLLRLPWLGDRKVAQIMTNIEIAKKSLPLRRWLNSFGIPWIGKQMSKIIADYIERDGVMTWTGIWDWLRDPQKLRVIDGIGDVGEQKIPEWSIKTYFIAQELEKLTCVWMPTQEKKIHDGFVICLTWTFPISRWEMTTMLEYYGHRVSDSVSSQTTLVLAWHWAWSKIEKAQAKWIRVVSGIDIFTIFPWLEQVIVDAERKKISNEGWLFV